jgi:hypothetical protein
MKNFFYYFDIYARYEKLEQDETGFPDIPPDKKIDMMAQFLMNPFKGTTLAVSRLQKPEDSISGVAKGLQ